MPCPCLTSFVLVSMIVSGAGRSVAAKAFLQVGFDSPLFVTLLYLISQTLSLAVYFVVKKIRANCTSRFHGNNDDCHAVLIRQSLQLRPVFCVWQAAPCSNGYSSGSTQKKQSRQEGKETHRHQQTSLRNSTFSLESATNDVAVAASRMNRIKILVLA